MVLPAEAYSFENERDQIRGLRAHVHGASGYGCGRFDRVTGIVGPKQFQVCGKGRSGDAGQLRVAAKLRPLARRGLGSRAQPDARWNEEKLTPLHPARKWSAR